jgi:cobyrinic acid a,c-diamide synthase
VAAALVSKHIDLDAVAALAHPWQPLATASDADAPCLAPLGQRIAVACDHAFAFAYPAVLEGWQRAGATLTLFSPLADEAPSDDADAVYLPGGYPELHAGKLAASSTFLRGLRGAAERGAVVYGECGGYMVLGEGLVDADGQRHGMAALLPLETTFAQRRLHLGYRSVRLIADGPLGRAGQGWRGHEFHYAGVVREDGAAPLFEAADARGRGLGAHGLVRGGVAGSFVHLIDSSSDAPGMASSNRLASSPAVGQFAGVGRPVFPL